ncbi:hypothetical protein MRB53_023349 [Persea americana]|uniref:Uncharacterized protein n=1 Tax=Persea americana TaxID=3435 RepID=A0ACC2L955_PERAE|nr:hypothetical protein MRB53_023349 [Persea americana]
MILGNRILWCIQRLVEIMPALVKIILIVFALDRGFFGFGSQRLESSLLSSIMELKELRSAWQVATERAAACCIVGNGGGVDVAESRKALLHNLWTERIHGAKQNVEYDDSSMMKLVFPLSCCTLPVGNGVGVDVAERRKALFRNMWTERMHGAKQDVELTQNADAVGEKVLAEILTQNTCEDTNLEGLLIEKPSSQRFQWSLMKIFSWRFNVLLMEIGLRFSPVTQSPSSSPGGEKREGTKDLEIICFSGDQNLRKEFF